jgi:inosine-uridine nucleoside N-ribohydrolase
MASQPGQPQAIFIDTDIGVDDGVAIAWLLRNPAAAVVGCTSVAGNTSVENATHNLLTLLDAADCEVPIAMGASAPLQIPGYYPGISAFVHGPSGLWSAQVVHDLTDVPRDAPAAIAAAARANPGMILLALGPLTNVAQAIQRFREDLLNIPIIALAGAQCGGNRTPIAEFNAFFDPHALDTVLNSGLDVTLVLLDAFKLMTVESATFLRELECQDDALTQLLATALKPYLDVQVERAGVVAAIPDSVAAIYALHPELGETSSALAQVVTEEGLTRGQTVIVTGRRSRMPLIADDAEQARFAARVLSTPGFDLDAELARILARRPDNIRVVLNIDAETMRRLLVEGFRMIENQRLVQADAMNCA